jgi:hypothetical protein
MRGEEVGGEQVTELIALHDVAKMAGDSMETSAEEALGSGSDVRADQRNGAELDATAKKLLDAIVKAAKGEGDWETVQELLDEDEGAGQAAGKSGQKLVE